MSGHVVALCGGVGGAKLAHGLSRALKAQDLTIIVNTGDDFEHLGLSVSPDLDSVIYALAGLSDRERGWGRRDETWNFMLALKGLGGETWFQLGDGDLAMHVERSRRLRQGASLSEVTAHFCAELGIGSQVLPMSDDSVHTRVSTDEGWLDFQDYFVRQQCRPVVRGLEFAGAATARPQPIALAALQRRDLRAIVICPSNPFLSVDPILAVPGIREAIRDAEAPVIAVTPIIAGKAVKGPAAKMMAEQGFEVSGTAVARYYADLIDGFVLDENDAIPAAVDGIRFYSERTLMVDDDDRINLATAVLRVADELAGQVPAPIADGR